MTSFRAPLVTLLSLALGAALILAMLSGDYDLTVGNVADVLAAHLGVSERTVYRWIERSRQEK